MEITISLVWLKKTPETTLWEQSVGGAEYEGQRVGCAEYEDEGAKTRRMKGQRLKG